MSDVHWCLWLDKFALSHVFEPTVMTFWEWMLIWIDVASDFRRDFLIKIGDFFSVKWIVSDELNKQVKILSVEVSWNEEKVKTVSFNGADEEEILTQKVMTEIDDADMTSWVEKVMMSMKNAAGWAKRLMSGTERASDNDLIKMNCWILKVMSIYIVNEYEVCRV